MSDLGGYESWQQGENFIDDSFNFYSKYKFGSYGS